ncbi:MAG: hypothetical protein HC906_04365 [Bacteroidales bacterium]|nr:hypothetical protein [Bacteroidales bacterium]
MGQKRILVTVPGENARGGINTYYRATKPFYKNNMVYIIRGSRNYPEHSSLLIQFTRLVFDFLFFGFNVFFTRKNLVHINMSLDKRGFFRDTCYVFASVISGSRTLVFFHGWDKDYEKLLNPVYTAIPVCLWESRWFYCFIYGV